MEFKDSKTYKNLQTAYKDKLTSSGKYALYGKMARQDGFLEIGNIYDVASSDDSEHARIWLRQLNQGTLPNTATTLQDSAEGELLTANETYHEFATIAKEEGYNDIASLFNGVSNIDFNHATKFQNLHQNVLENQVFCKPTTKLWICMQCGNIMSGECAPQICPVCAFPQNFYKLLDADYFYR